MNEEEQDNRYGIKTTRYWFNHGDTHEVECDGIGRPLIFGTRDDAQRWIESADQTVYELSHSECARPDYKPVKVQSAWYRGELGRIRQYQPFAGVAK